MGATKVRREEEKIRKKMDAWKEKGGGAEFEHVRVTLTSSEFCLNLWMG